MVARFRSRMAPINSSKNVVDASGNSLAGAPASTVIVRQEDPITTDAGVPLGSTVNSIFVSNFWFSDTIMGSDLPLIDWYIIKDPGGSFSAQGFVATGLPTPGSTGRHNNRKWIIHEEKGLVGATSDGVPMVFKGAFKLPPKMRRFGESDILLFAFKAENVGKFCQKFIYKRFT